MFDLSIVTGSQSWIVITLCIVIVVVTLAFWRRSKKPSARQQFTREYFKGLNYLLNDEQGKALDIFVKLVESDWEIIDTHFALGRIFRKNGEIDKAIKIHQGLIARPSLPDKYKSKVLLELGFDYLVAGWFDRAEGLFKEVLLQDKHSTIAHRNLIMIYEQEKDWHKAIEVAVDLFAEDPSGIGPMISQYYCELAEQAKTKGDVSQLENNANQALRYDASSVRASIMLGQQSMVKQDFRQAIRYFEQVELQDADYIPLVISELITCYEELKDESGLIDYMSALVKRQQNVDLIEDYAVVLEKYRGIQPVIEFLGEKIRNQPSIKGMHQLLTYYQKQEEQPSSVYASLNESLRSMQSHDAEYKCHRCGFEANTLYWLCPSCQRWAQVKPSVAEVAD